MVKPETFGHLHLVYHFTVPVRRWQLWIVTQVSFFAAQVIPSRLKIAVHFKTSSFKHLF